MATPLLPEISDAEKKQRGQFFTRNDEVHQVMMALVAHHEGRALEPSAGAGHLVTPLEARPGLSIDAVELDDRVRRECVTPITYGDFFTWAQDKDGAYDVIFGNPPYVAWKAVEGATRESAKATKAAYSDLANLYYLFIDRCVDLLTPGGELVFIVPKEWLYTTSALPLRQKMNAAGAITDLIDCGEEKLFADADVPALLIFRFEKGAAPRTLTHFGSLSAALEERSQRRVLRDENGRWMLLTEAETAAVEQWGRLGDVFSVKVGLVTGADKVFKVSDDLDLEPDCVQDQLTTRQQPERFINVNGYDRFEDIPPKTAAYLAQHKETLLARRIARFDETNWWRYGAIRNDAFMASDTPRLFAMAKTRKQPFFSSDATHFGGGILGLFALSTDLDLGVALRVLQDDRFRRILEGMFVTSKDKVTLQPGTLEDAPFPRTTAQALAWLGQEDASMPVAA